MKSLFSHFPRTLSCRTNIIPLALSCIFLLAFVLRLLFFPDNIYFGFDQARDVFIAQDISHLHLKLVGPTSSLAGLNHGVLYYYFITPWYMIGQGNPAVLSFFLRLLNCSGVLIIFCLANLLFKDKKTSFIAAVLFAFAFEQTQFSIYMGNPSPAVLTELAMYLGLALVIFKNYWWGIVLAVLCLGLSIQFEVALIYLTIPFILTIILFRKRFLKIPLRIWGISIALGFLSVGTFIIAEIKYHFPTVHLISGMSHQSHHSLTTALRSYLDTLNTMSSLNITGRLPLSGIVLAGLLLILAYLLKKNKPIRQQLIFLSIWFFSLLSVYIIGGGRTTGEQLYYTNEGVSLSMIIFLSFIISTLLKQFKILGMLIIALIVTANLNMILTLNPKGTITSINVQQAMLLSDEKKVIDAIYSDAHGKPFAAKALTIPLSINTTWSYLYEWYGLDRYHYLPVWGDKNAPGYPGHLKVIDAQTKLPPDRYLVIEPLRGLQDRDIQDYLRVEGYFTYIVWQKKIGQFQLQKREPIQN